MRVFEITKKILKAVRSTLSHKDLCALCAFNDISTTGLKRNIQDRLENFISNQSYNQLLIINNKINELLDTRKSSTPTANSVQDTTQTYIPDYLSSSMLKQAPINLDEEVSKIDRKAVSIFQFTTYPNAMTAVPVDTDRNHNVRIPNFLPHVPVEISPFYCCVVCLHPLSLLVAKTMPNVSQVKGTQRVNSNSSIQFTLSDEAFKLINKNSINLGSRTDFKWQVLLRFVAIDPTKQLPSSSRSIPQVIPPYLQVKVNGESIPLWDIIPSNTPAKEGKRHPKPVVITDKLNKSRGNDGYKQSIAITFWQTPEVYQYYYIGAYLERKLSVREILDLFTSNRHVNILPVEYTLNFIKTKLHKDRHNDDDDIVVSSFLPISLSCPVGRSRIEIPIRTLNCQHLQCFDAQLFLSMNERRSIWKCPVCEISATPNELFCDKYFMSILKKYKDNEDVNDINVSADGSVVPASQNKDDTVDKRNELSAVTQKTIEVDNMIVLDSDEEEEPPQKSKTNIDKKSNSQSLQVTPQPKVPKEKTPRNDTQQSKNNTSSHKTASSKSQQSSSEKSAQKTKSTQPSSTVESHTKSKNNDKSEDSQQNRLKSVFSSVPKAPISTPVNKIRISLPTVISPTSAVALASQPPKNPISISIPTPVISTRSLSAPLSIPPPNVTGNVTINQPAVSQDIIRAPFDSASLEATVIAAIRRNSTNTVISAPKLQDNVIFHPIPTLPLQPPVTTQPVVSSNRISMWDPTTSPTACITNDNRQKCMWDTIMVSTEPPFTRVPPPASISSYSTFPAPTNTRIHSPSVSATCRTTLPPHVTLFDPTTPSTSLPSHMATPPRFSAPTSVTASARAPAPLLVTPHARAPTPSSLTVPIRSPGTSSITAVARAPAPSSVTALTRSPAPSSMTALTRAHVPSSMTAAARAPAPSSVTALSRAPAPSSMTTAARAPTPSMVIASTPIPQRSPVTTSPPAPAPNPAPAVLTPHVSVTKTTCTEIVKSINDVVKTLSTNFVPPMKLNVPQKNFVAMPISCPVVIVDDNNGLNARETSEPACSPQPLRCISDSTAKQLGPPSADSISVNEVLKAMNESRSVYLSQRNGPETSTKCTVRAPEANGTSVISNAVNANETTSKASEIDRQTKTVDIPAVFFDLTGDDDDEAVPLVLASRPASIATTTTPIATIPSTVPAPIATNVFVAPAATIPTVLSSGPRKNIKWCNVNDPAFRSTFFSRGAPQRPRFGPGLMAQQRYGLGGALRTHQVHMPMSQSLAPQQRFQVQPQKNQRPPIDLTDEVVNGNGPSKRRRLSGGESSTVSNGNVGGGQLADSASSSPSSSRSSSSQSPPSRRIRRSPWH